MYEKRFVLCGILNLLPELNANTSRWVTGKKKPPALIIHSKELQQVGRSLLYTYICNIIQTKTCKANRELWQHIRPKSSATEWQLKTTHISHCFTVWTTGWLRWQAGGPGVRSHASGSPAWTPLRWGSGCCWPRGHRRNKHPSEVVLLCGVLWSCCRLTMESDLVYCICILLFGISTMGLYISPIAKRERCVAAIWRRSIIQP